MTRISKMSGMRWRQMGFSQQLVIAFCIGILVASVTSSIVISLLSGQTIRDRFILDGHKAAETLALQSTLILLYQSAENGREYAETLLSAPDVLGVAVYDTSGAPLLTLGELGETGPDPLVFNDRLMTVETESSWHFFAPVYTSPALSADSPFTVNPGAPELLGHVQVIMGKDTLRRVTGDILKTNFLVSSVLAVTLLAVLLFITGRVTRPIKSLADTMRRATSGERRIRADIAGPRDVAEMQHAFNKMMEVLDAREMELKKARDAALESARIKGEFAATVSHELRTPLNGVLGMLELLQGMGLTPKQADYVEVAKTSGESLLMLVNDILDFSRNDSGEATGASDDFDLPTALDEIIGLTGSQARRKGLELGFALGREVPHALRGDTRRLQQVLLNLVGNAIKFTEYGEVRVTVEVEERRDEGRFFLHFEVRDSGVGIPEQARTRIFEPFRQLDGSTTRRYGGSGLGLAICKQIIEFVGGEIGVRSTPGAGSTFWFTFPFSHAEQPVASALQPDPRLRGRRILVTDDSELVRRLVRQTCEQWGMVVQTAETMQQMLDLLRTQEIETRLDLLLVDEDLQGAYGKTVHDMLSTEPVFSRIPTILLSPHIPSEGGDHHPAIRAYVDKPVRTALLHKALMGALPTPVAAVDGAAPEGHASSQLADAATVLVVEDNRSNQIVVAGMLERLGLEAALASSGAEALAHIQQRAFDLILMDCNMPEMDGFQTTACIRSLQGGDAHTPIIAMTANVQEGDAEKCLAAGMDDYISKPLKLSTLRDKLHGWLDRRASGGGARAQEPKSAPVAVELEPTLDEEFVTELRETLGNAFTRLLTVFIEDLPDYVEALREAIDDAVAERVSGVAHTIKGSAANIGARRLAEISKRIEAAGRNGDFDTAQELYGLIRGEADKLLALLEERLNPAQKEGGGKEDDHAAASYILVVDDDRATRFGLRNILEEEGYTVVEADDGVRAIELCKQRAPELILMDAKMPAMDGFTACHFLKQQEEYSHIPVLIITGLEDDDSIERAFSVGATDYISKPVNFSVLRRRIAHLMNASRAERNMKRLAYNDSLTGLPNRVLFTNHLNRLLHIKRDEKQGLAVMFIDVNRFKLINDTLGHDAGDMLLKIVAERISNCVRENDLVARLGGDEFTIVIDNVESQDVLAGIARKICQSFTKPVVFLDREIFITLSIGISVYPADAEDLASLMKHADTAMFHAKRYGNDFCFFESTMAADVSRRLALENDLRRAIERQELIVYYQPQADVASGRIIGMEALVRWRHPERGLVPPLDFIPLAEDIGLIGDIGEFVLHESCRQLRAWLDRGYEDLRISVNISGRQIEKGEIIKAVSDALIASRLPPNHLELEITESVVMEHAEDMIEVFRQFKEMNLHLAIDDFGTGYSSLAYLKRFPVDTIKIDQSFVHDVPGDSEDVAIVTGVIAMVKGLGLKVVAEGVENSVQVEFLRGLGCDYIQGYCLSEPLPPEEFERRFLASPQRRRPGGGMTMLKKSS